MFNLTLPIHAPYPPPIVTPPTPPGFDPNTVQGAAVLDVDGKLTLAAPSSATKWCLGAWVQRVDLSKYNMICFAGDLLVTGLCSALYFDDAGRLRVGQGGDEIMSTRLFRDTAWYHVIWDMNGTSSQIYINGKHLSEVDRTMTGGPYIFNGTDDLVLGSKPNSLWSCMNFAQTFALHGQSIQAGDVTVDDILELQTYGANGSQYVPKPDADIEALAAAAGGDSFALTSGIATGTAAVGANFTPTGTISGSANTPSNPGVIWDALNNFQYYEIGFDTTWSSARLSKGGVRAQVGGNFDPWGYGRFRANVALSTGKYAWRIETNSNFSSAFGIELIDEPLDISVGVPGAGKTMRAYWWNDDSIFADATGNQSSANRWTYTGNFEWLFCVDFDAGYLWMSRDGGTTWVSGDPNTGTPGEITWTGGTRATPIGVNYRNDNYVDLLTDLSGQTVPTGFLPLTHANMSTPTAQGCDVSNVVQYTGNGTNQSITGMGFQPDWLMLSGGTVVPVVDSVRGPNKYLQAQDSSAEVSDASYVSSLDADGFSVGSGVGTNSNGTQYTAWSMQAGTSSVTNNDGTLTSSVSVHPSGFFSVGTYTGTNDATITVGHGLGGRAEFVVSKPVTGGGGENWTTYHHLMNNGSSPADNGTLYLGLDNPYAIGSNLWTHTLFTDSVFAANGNGGQISRPGVLHSFMAMRSIEGLCKVGYYTSDFAYVHCGFRPRWILQKSVGTGPWQVYDTQRSPNNVVGDVFWVNDGLFYSSGFDDLDILSDGFKVRRDDAYINTGSVFIAIADIAGGGTLPPIYGR